MENRIYLDKIPDYTENYIKEKGIHDFIAIACSDMTSAEGYGNTWLVADNESICIFEGYEQNGEWIELTFAKYFYSEIERFYIDTFISTGILIGVSDEKDFSLVSFSNACARKIGSFANILNKLKNGEDINPDEYSFEEFEEFCPKCGSRYMDRERKICPKCIKRGALFRRVMTYGLKYKWLIMLTFIGIVAAALIALVRPQLTNKFLFDEVLNKSSAHYGKIVPLMISIALLEVVSFGISVFNGRLGAKISAKIIFDIKLELFSAMQNLSLSFYNSKHTGNLMTRVNNDAEDIQYFLNDGMPHFIMNVFNLLGILFIMISYNPLLAAIVFIPVPFIVLIIKKSVPKFRKYKWNSWSKRSRINSLINDSLTGMRVVKAFGKEDREIKRFNTANNQLYDAAVMEGKAAAKTFPMLSYLMTIGSLFVWGIGGWQVIQGDITFGILSTFVSYVGMVYGPLDFMVRIFDWYTNCMNSAQRIFEIIDKKSDITESENPISMPDMEGQVSIKNVTFEYEPNKPVLHNINLEVKAGEMIGLVGHSGAGKSTITNLITRLYDVNDGGIYIDGVNIKDIKIDDLRSQIGMVLQETYLFSGTIADNIAYARPDASREEIIAAAKLANAHDFIMKMNDGYDTFIGKHKNNLSGGEKQRISIARAILVNPRILILDEATASVDTETERLIQEALERLVEGRTTFAIAHRLSTLRNADRLVVVDHGTIAECGTHEELELQKGIYYDMLNIQKEALKRN